VRTPNHLAVYALLTVLFSAILENVTEVIVTLNQQSQDALVLQGKALMLSLLTAYAFFRASCDTY
jgi:hypothetical protein